MFLDRIIDAAEITWWLGAALTFIAFATAIVMPFRKLIKRYDNELKGYQEKISRQQEINQMQSNAISESLEDRCELRELFESLRVASLAQIKVELTKVCDRAIERGFIYPKELEVMETLYEPYPELHGNGVVTSKVMTCRKLPLHRSPKEINL